jgi:hypothetical protein
VDRGSRERLIEYMASPKAKLDAPPGVGIL